MNWDTSTARKAMGAGTAPMASSIRVTSMGVTLFLRRLGRSMLPTGMRV